MAGGSASPEWCATGPATGRTCSTSCASPRRKGEAKGLAWSDFRDLIIAAHRSLSAPLVWCWDNLNVHLAPELAEFATLTWTDWSTSSSAS